MIWLPSNRFAAGMGLQRLSATWRQVCSEMVAAIVVPLKFALLCCGIGIEVIVVPPKGLNFSLQHLFGVSLLPFCALAPSLNEET